MQHPKLFQLSAFALHTYAYFYLFFIRKHEYDYGYGGQFKQFTVWTHTLNVIFYTINLINVSESLKTWVFKLSFTCSILVSVMFWGIHFAVGSNAFMIDPRFYPTWLNHAQHTAPSIIALMELSLVHYAYHSLLLEVIVVSTFGMTYFGWIHYARSKCGFYPYPFMDVYFKEQITSFIVFSAIVCMFAVIVHSIGRVLSSIIHKAQVVGQKTANKLNQKASVLKSE